MSVQSDVFAAPRVTLNSAARLIVEFHKFAFIFAVCSVIVPICELSESAVSTAALEIGCEIHGTPNSATKAESCNHYAYAERADDDIAPDERGLFATVTGVQSLPQP